MDCKWRGRGLALESADSLGDDLSNLRRGTGEIGGAESMSSGVSGRGFVLLSLGLAPVPLGRLAEAAMRSDNRSRGTAATGRDCVNSTPRANRRGRLRFARRCHGGLRQ